MRLSRLSLSTRVCSSTACTARSARPLLWLSPTGDHSGTVSSSLRAMTRRTNATSAGSWSLLMMTLLCPSLRMSCTICSAAHSMSPPFAGTTCANNALLSLSRIAVAGVVPSTPGSPMKKKSIATFGTVTSVSSTFSCGVLWPLPYMQSLHQLRKGRWATWCSRLSWAVGAAGSLTRLGAWASSSSLSSSSLQG